MSQLLKDHQKAKLPPLPAQFNPSMSETSTVDAIHQPDLPGTESVYALHVWPCSVYLAQHVWANRAEFTGKRVLELGAGGTGLPGIAALKAGAQHGFVRPPVPTNHHILVIFTDAPGHDAAFELLRRNVTSNFSDEDGDIENRFSIAPLDWRRPLDQEDLKGKIDLILAADCFYDPSVFDDCLRTIAALLELGEISQNAENIGEASTSVSSRSSESIRNSRDLKNPSRKDRIQPYCLFAYQVRDSNWSIEQKFEEYALECDLVDPGAVHSGCVGVDDPTFGREIQAHTVYIGRIRRGFWGLGFDYVMGSERSLILAQPVRFKSVHSSAVNITAAIKYIPSNSLKDNIESSGSTTKRRGHLPPKDFSPIPWSEFFDDQRQVKVNGTDTFNVYIKGKLGPVFYLLHGGGYSGLTWACFAEELSQLIDCTFVAPDLRAHGLTETEDETDLSTEKQVEDIRQIFDALKDVIGDRPVFLIGHSMGGALAVHAAPHISHLCSICVIDVVEGSALDALKGMQTFLRSRPEQFKSVEQAVEWCLKSGTVRNHRSARVSMPTQIRALSSSAQPESSLGQSLPDDQLLEEDEEMAEESSNSTNDNETSGSSTSPSSSNGPPTCYGWRIDLMKSEPHWRGWFTGLSNKFLDVHAPKLLLLAGVDRLDKDLTIGQMQGKFQMVVLPRVGHCVHEDNPGKVADTIATFCVRNKLATAKADFTPVHPRC